MGGDLVQTLSAFLMASSLTLIIFLLIEGRGSRRMETRLRQLSNRDTDDFMGQLARSSLPRMGAALAPSTDADRTRLQTRLIQAGLYSKEAMPIFLGVKLLLMIGPPLLGLVAALLGFVTMSRGLMFGAITGIIGTIGPSFWLDARKTERQRRFRIGLPDALDVMVICLEGGLSLPGAIKKVAEELITAHPLLAGELRIVEREIQLGRPMGEALRGFGDRADMEELRNLSSVVSQSERFGSSLVRALRVHAEVMREKRLLYAEEMAQKAATKILFPTILFIFPGVFIVVLGPAVIQIMGWMGGTKG